MHGRAHGREGGDDSRGWNSPTEGGWLGSPGVSLSPPRVAMPSTSPSDERTCDTTTLLRHYLCLSTWFLTALAYTLSFPIFSSPFRPPSLTLIPGVHLLRPLSFCSSTPTATTPLRTSFPLSIRASDFSALSAVPETFPITRLLIAIRFPRDLRKFVGNYTYLETNVFRTQCFSDF